MTKQSSRIRVLLKWILPNIWFNKSVRNSNDRHHRLQQNVRLTTELVLVKASSQLIPLMAPADPRDGWTLRQEVSFYPRGS